MNQAEALRLRRGTAGVPSDMRVFRVGPLSVTVDGADVRFVRWGDVEVVQRIYMAVRDPAWNTVPGQISDVEVDERPDSFEIRFVQRHIDGEIDIVWNGRIAGNAQGLVVYEMDASVQRDCRHAKIGLNIHHPLEGYVGRPFRAHTPDGEVTGTLPAIIEPQLVRDGTLTAMFPYFDRISFVLDSGVSADFAFEGDFFEMQDHRNWSDANFKTYGTPLAFGFPFDAHAGDRLHQRIVLTVGGEPSSRPEWAIDDIDLRYDEAVPVPRIGHAVAHEHDDAAHALLAPLRPDHVRVDVTVGGDRAHEEFARGLAVAKALGAAVEVAFFLQPSRLEQDAESVATLVESAAGAVARVFAFAAAEGFSEFRGATPREIPVAVRDALRRRGLDVAVHGGTDQFFNEINRARPDYSGLDGVAFSLNPQVHAADDRSLAENVAALPDMTATCRELMPGLAVAVSPIALVGVNGPYPGGPGQADDLPPNVDPRLSALYGAAWTAAMLRSAALAGTSSVTLFDLAGSRGIVAGDGPPGDAAADLRPRPVYHLFAALTDARRAGRMVAASSSDPFVGAFALLGEGLTACVFNLSPAMRSVSVEPFDAESVDVLVLDETTVHYATDHPEEFRRSRSTIRVVGSRLPLVLRPYGVAIVTTG